MIIVEMTADKCVVEPERKVYLNSEVGRSALEADSAEIENYSEYIGIWGDEPTVFPPPATEAQPTDSERITELEEALEMILNGVTE